MAVKYKIYQSNRKGDFQGKWYARAQHEGIISTNEIADIIQNNCSVKRSDVLAVISELVEVMNTQLQNSMKVKLDRFGTFKLGITTTPASTAKEFTATSNISGVHVLFAPELTIDAKGTRQKVFVTGAKVQEATQYSVDKSGDSSSSTDASGSSTDGDDSSTPTE